MGPENFATFADDRVSFSGKFVSQIYSNIAHALSMFAICVMFFVKVEEYNLQKQLPLPLIYSHASPGHGAGELGDLRRRLGYVLLGGKIQDDGLAGEDVIPFPDPSTTARSKKTTFSTCDTYLVFFTQTWQRFSTKSIRLSIQ